ncbi:MAG TPA: sugar phosphate isomerase/epimerase, partial [Phycisphaerales bacterium]|nr:sugar phosphate isomerase/epimerase [Phycisphaerales bacterium]
ASAAWRGERVIPEPGGRDSTAADALGWELGTQAWTFRDRSCYEAIDTARALGLTCIELFPGQALSPGLPEVKVGPGMSAQQRSELKGKLAACGVRAHSFGVVNPSADEGSLREILAFASDMGMRGIACEPVLAGQERPSASWALLGRLTREYGLYAACHNHPRPSTYWDPEVVLREIGEFDKSLIGACADTGHWTRSGLSTVESLRRYEGRILELHFKDVKDNIDHPWGTGGGDARGQLAELRRQGFRGAVFVEYEHGSGRELDENVRRCVAFFDATARELS